MIVNCRVHLRYYFKWPVEAYLKGRQPLSRACVMFNSNKTLISFLLDPSRFFYPWVIAQLPSNLHMNLLQIEVNCLDAHTKKIILLWGIDIMYLLCSQRQSNTLRHLGHQWQQISWNKNRNVLWWFRKYLFVGLLFQSPACQGDNWHQLLLHKADLWHHISTPAWWSSCGQCFQVSG